MIPPPIEQARRINRTWIVHGNLARDTEDYLSLLEKDRPEILRQVCALAVAAARAASREKRDPKPGFYASLFCRATAEERSIYLKDHPWTLRLSAELQAADPGADRLAP